jgi:hypothetical protein
MVVLMAVDILFPILLGKTTIISAEALERTDFMLSNTLLPSLW